MAKICPQFLHVFLCQFGCFIKHVFLAEVFCVMYAGGVYKTFTEIKKNKDSF